MHVENELAEIMITGDHKFEEIIEKYEEEILVQEEVPESHWLTQLTPGLPKASSGA